MARQLYFNGDPIEAPVLTDLEKKLAKQLSLEDFGDSSSADGYITLSDGSFCEFAGLERVNEIKWEGGRQQLGGLLTSLQEKRLIIIDNPEDGYGLTVWFDCAALWLLADTED